MPKIWLGDVRVSSIVSPVAGKNSATSCSDSTLFVERPTKQETKRTRRKSLAQTRICRIGLETKELPRLLPKQCAKWKSDRPRQKWMPTQSWSLSRVLCVVSSVAVKQRKQPTSKKNKEQNDDCPKVWRIRGMLDCIQITYKLSARFHVTSDSAIVDAELRLENWSK